MSEAQQIEQMLVGAGDTVVVETAILRALLRRHRQALAAEARVDAYAQRVADVSALTLDDHLMPDGSF